MNGDNRKTGRENYQTCLRTIQYTQAEMNARQILAMQGRPHIEGRIICQTLKLQLHVMEFREFQGKLKVRHVLIDKNGGRFIEAEALFFDSPNLIHLGVYRGQYVPLFYRPPHACSLFFYPPRSQINTNKNKLLDLNLDVQHHLLQFLSTCDIAMSAGVCSIMNKAA
jgi:hypothetical protein